MSLAAIGSRTRRSALHTLRVHTRTRWLSWWLLGNWVHLVIGFLVFPPLAVAWFCLVDRRVFVQGGGDVRRKGDKFEPFAYLPLDARALSAKYVSPVVHHSM